MSTTYNDARARERAMLATIRIINPLEEDFSMVYDSRKWTIKAGETRDVPRYIAEHFALKMGQMIAVRAEDEDDEKFKQELKRKGHRYAPNHEDRPGNRPHVIDIQKYADEMARKIFVGKVADYSDDDVVDEKVPVVGMDKEARETISNFMDSLPTVE